jgi:hypothetical protein
MKQPLATSFWGRGDDEIDFLWATMARDHVDLIKFIASED